MRHSENMADASPIAPDIERAMSYVAKRSNGEPMPEGLAVTLNFHPDAFFKGRLTIEALRDDGFYRSQFETGTSNGGLTAHPGGDRWVWESQMFGSAYDDADPAVRPKYGALNYRRLLIGGSPRFGSCHLRLRPHVLSRTTFCYPDSYLNPVNFGVQDRMGLVSIAEQNVGSVDFLDDYIEAHVHGRLSLRDDVDALVLDPSYRGTRVEAVVAALPCPVEWHSGFRMLESRLPECVEYRGQEYAVLAASLMIDGQLTPREIGEALHRNVADPQTLKRVWHCVACFGSP